MVDVRHVSKLGGVYLHLITSEKQMAMMVLECLGLNGSCYIYFDPAELECFCFSESSPTLSGKMEVPFLCQQYDS